ncbi:CASP-like protein 1E1 [Mercurialis annua]|uniref:CASP-like protein 1E1 n=1 Tax=Mercurialis annua TaxID=3986 RepID=UPI00215F149C|nr:CASP-like protein 1E1 [Mercurialis annua]
MIMDSQSKNMSVGAMDVAESRMIKERRGNNLLGLRVLALVLTLTAAIVLGVDKQTKIVPIQLTPALPPLNVPLEAKWHYLSAFVFFVISNAIASAYAAISLILSCCAKKRMLPMILILDLLMVALLFCSNGAATAIGLMGYKGNSHVRWNKVCHVFGRFCNQVAASLIISLLGSLVFLLLVMLTTLRLHRKSIKF